LDDPLNGALNIRAVGTQSAFPQSSHGRYLAVFALSLGIFLPSLPVTGQEATAKYPNQPSHQLRTLTTAREVHDLTVEDAARHYPVHFRAICIVCYPDWHGFFANDGASTVYVETRNQVLLTAAIHSGTLLEIDGVTGPGEYAPIVDRSSLRVLGERPLPPARLVSLDRLSSGVEEGQWVAFEGTVRSIEHRDSMLALVVASGRLQVEVMTLPGGQESGRLLNARVRVRGTVGPVFNKRAQLTAIHVYSPSLDDIRVLRPALIDPFSIPLRPVKGVFEYAPGAGIDHLVRIRGVVTARLGQTVYLNDGVQGASVLSREVTTVEPGDIVDAAGYPALGDPAHTIVDAIFRQLGTAPTPEPKTVSVKEALSGTVEGDLVRLEGRVIEQQKTADQSTLLVDAGGVVFSAILPGELREQSLASLRDGSRIQLTGICVITETQATRHFLLPKAFQILMRSPSDVVVIESPSWWTVPHALLVLAFVLTGMLAVLAWGFALRRRVAQQTDLLRNQADRLRESEEKFRQMALHDALTGLATRLLLKDRMDVALESARRHRTGLAVLIVDLDRFKEVNDTHGHEAGDEVLRATAQRLLKAVRIVDTVARLGGDEFVVLLPDLKHLHAAERIAANLVESLAVPIPFNGVDIQVSGSIGVSAVSALGLNGENLMRDADAALYLAKAKGRNCFQVYARQNSR